MTVPSASGFAAIYEGKIDVRTVSPTERATMVNALAMIGGCMIGGGVSDEDIERVFLAMAAQHGVSIMPVSIRPMPN